MITTSGFLRAITSLMVSRFVSHKSSKVSVKVPIRSARILICCKDSSPDTYNIARFLLDRFLHTCNNKVDLPIPGSPPTNTSDPLTIPPPSTRSNSFMDVEIRSSSADEMADNGIGFASSNAFFTPAVEVFLSTISSTKVFHSLHPGHCPIHFADSNPQFWQKYILLFPFAIIPPTL